MDKQPNNRIHASPALQDDSSTSAGTMDGFSGLLAETAAKYAAPDAEPAAEADIQAESADRQPQA
ncbi:MAG: hypothetical protein KKI08_15865 [Armatimonadetes bacterium]|nr:hypothetical protein [Armatimonadota bacterium]